MKKWLYILGTICIIGTLLFVSRGNVYAESDSDSKIDISISPQDYLFNIENMKPGDWATRDVIVENSGNHHFKYNASVQLEGGSKKLFNEFLLEIDDKDGELYRGKLSEFKALTPRDLKSGQSEKLSFTIRFPKALGNEYQGLHSQFKLIFAAEGKNNATATAASGSLIGGNNNGTPLADGNGKLPNTATDMFTYILAGGSIIVIGLIVYMLQRIVKVRRDG